MVVNHYIYQMAGSLDSFSSDTWGSLCILSVPVVQEEDLDLLFLKQVILGSFFLITQTKKKKILDNHFHSSIIAKAVGNDSFPEALILSAPNCSYLSQIKGSFSFSKSEQFSEEAMPWPLAKIIISWSHSISSVNPECLHFEFYKVHRPLQRSQTNLHLLMEQRKH